MPPIVRVEKDGPISSLKGFRFYVIEISGLPLPPPLIASSETSKASIEIQYWVSFYDTKERCFFGKTWKSHTYQSTLRRGETEVGFSFLDSEDFTSLYFHGIDWDGVVLVLEIVSVDANSPAGLKSIAWCLLPVTMAHTSENEEGQMVEFYPGSPRVLTLIDTADQPNLGKYDGIVSLQRAGILNSIGPHFWLRYGLEIEKHFDAFAYLFPPYHIASDDKSLPGIKFDSAGGWNYIVDTPVLDNHCSVLISNPRIIVPQSLMEFESQMANNLSRWLQSQNQLALSSGEKHWLPSFFLRDNNYSFAKELKLGPIYVLERRIGIGAHNGLNWISEPEKVTLNSITNPFDEDQEFYAMDGQVELDRYCWQKSSSFKIITWLELKFLISAYIPSKKSDSNVPLTHEKTLIIGWSELKDWFPYKEQLEYNPFVSSNLETSRFPDSLMEMGVSTLNSTFDLQFDLYVDFADEVLNQMGWKVPLKPQQNDQSVQGNDFADMQPIFAHPEIQENKEPILREAKGPNVNFKFHRVGFRPLKDGHGNEFPQDYSFNNLQTIPSLTYSDQPQGLYTFHFEAMAISLDNISDFGDSIFFKHQFYCFGDIESPVAFVDLYDSWDSKADGKAGKNIEFPCILFDMDKYCFGKDATPGIRWTCLVDGKLLSTSKALEVFQCFQDFPSIIEIYDGSSCFPIGYCQIPLQKFRPGAFSYQIRDAVNIYEYNTSVNGVRTFDANARVIGKMHCSVAYSFDSSTPLGSLKSDDANCQNYISRLGDPTCIPNKTFRFSKIKESNTECKSLVDSILNNEKEPSTMLKLQDLDIALDQNDSDLISSIYDKFQKRSLSMLIDNHLKEVMTTNVKLYPSYGEASLFEMKFQNPYETSQTFYISLGSSHLRIISNSDEWKYVRKIRKIVSVFPVEHADNVKRLSDGEYEIFVSGNESLCVPFIYQSFHVETNAELASPQRKYGQGDFAAGNVLQLKAEDIMVTVTDHRKKPCSLLSIQTFPQPKPKVHRLDLVTFPDHVFDAEIPLTWESVLSKDAVDQIKSAGDKFIHVSDSNLSIEKQGDSRLCLKYCATGIQDGKGSYYGKIIYAAFYSDDRKLNMIGLTQCRVSVLPKLQAYFVIGHSKNHNIVVKGGGSSRIVRPFLPHKCLISMQSGKSFELPAQSYVDLALTLKTFPDKACSFDYQFNLVEEGSLRLVKNYILQVQIELPRVSKHFDVILNSNTDSTHKRVSFHNPYHERQIFRVYSSNHKVLTIKDELISLGAGESGFIGLKFTSNLREEDKNQTIYIFITNQKGLIEECFSVKTSF